MAKEKGRSYCGSCKARGETCNDNGHDFLVGHGVMMSDRDSLRKIGIVPGPGFNDFVYEGHELCREIRRTYNLDDLPTPRE
jgi:hypothetical protein